jgi:thiol:disulfide interchange protein DsbD
MKNYAVFLFIITSMLVSCSGNEYREMKVYPVLNETAVARGSESFIALQVELPGKSHIYGNPKGPGIGKPTEVMVEGPKTITFSEARFLKPQKFYFPGEKDYTWGYEHATRIFLPFKVLGNAATGVSDIGVVFDSLLCTDPGQGKGASYCVPRIFRFKCRVRVLPEGSAGTVYSRSILDEFKASSAPGKGAAAVPAPAVKNEDTMSVLPEDLSFSPRFIEKGVTGLLQAVIFGIIAGILLNIMPCVLPVVSLKVMGFIQHAGKSRRELFLLGVVFSLGIIASFALLATLAAFFGYKWGGLFQHRLFLVAMTGIVFALSLSLFGVYTINIPSFAGRAVSGQSNPYGDAFMKGLLATLLATPCSGPFLGGTLAWTLSQSPGIIFLVFLCIGFGMSLPYIILTINPKFLKFIPKPGEWLVTFEKVMAFVLVFTVIYLVGILDEASVVPMITLLGFIAFGFWQYGRYGSVGQTGVKRVMSTIALAGILVGGYFISFDYLYRENKSSEITKNAFSAERLIANRDSGKISVIDFTADWCPNCRLVEKVTLQSEKVAEALNDPAIDFMVADITGINPDAERMMRLLQSQAIPLLAVVPPGDGFTRPIILRDIYSEQDVMKALETARSGNVNKEFRYQVDIKRAR